MKPIPYRGDQPFVFVSYAHDDATTVYAEIDRLTAVGFNVFYDEGISPGHSWHDELADALERCRILVFFVSQRSIASKNCLREIHFAEELDKPMLIVELENVELTGGLKLSIGDLQSIKAFELDAETYRARMWDALSEVLQPRATTQVSDPPPTPFWTAKRAVALSAAVLAMVVGSVLWNAYRSGQSATLARLAEAKALVQQDRYGDAFLIARELQVALEGDDRFAALLDDVIVPVSPQVAETGATVFMRPFSVSDEDWIELGETPIAGADAPRGVLQLRIEKAGRETGYFVVSNPGPLLQASGPTVPGVQLPMLELAETGAEDGMVVVPETAYSTSLQGTLQLDPYGGSSKEIPAFAIARREVTNAEYDDFVRAGGYEMSEYWQDLALPDGGTITMDQVGEWFVDRTGRNGPSTWELATYPAGDGMLPVGGISWHEANAYARFRGLVLPTVHHWTRAAQGPVEAEFVTAVGVSSAGNFLGDGPRAASQRAMGPWGALDMAGNVREWVWNDTSQGRLIMGGSWLDYPSIFHQAYSVSALDRSPQNGLRLMRELSNQPDASLAGPVELIVDLPGMDREPVPPEVFRGMQMAFTHSAKDLPALVEQVADRGDFVVEEVTLDDGAANPLVIYIGLPKRLSRPLQSVVYMGTLGAFQNIPNRDAVEHFDAEMEFLVRSGRAVVVPIWFGGHARYQARSTDPETLDSQLRERAVAWYRDAAKTIDYLETRTDFAANQIAYMGFSYGAINGPLVLAVERRFRAAVLVSGGVLPVAAPAMFDLVNYLPRIKQPVLYVTGRFDPIFPYNPTQLRFLELLGTADEDVTHVLFDDLGHFGYPSHRYNRAIIDWLDAQFGAVR